MEISHQGASYGHRPRPLSCTSALIVLSHNDRGVHSLIMEQSLPVYQLSFLTFKHQCLSHAFYYLCANLSTIVRLQDNVFTIALSLAMMSISYIPFYTHQQRKHIHFTFVYLLFIRFLHFQVLNFMLPNLFWILAMLLKVTPGPCGKCREMGNI